MWLINNFKKFKKKNPEEIIDLNVILCNIGINYIFFRNSRLVHWENFRIPSGPIFAPGGDNVESN